MKLNIKHFVIFITVLFVSCKQPNNTITTINGKRLLISDTIEAVDSIDKFIAPYKEHINDVLDKPIAYNPKTISKYDKGYNTAIGNLMADIVLEQSNPVFNKRTGKNIDFVLLNHGGIRAIISEGNVTTRTAYEIMPFENKVVVIELTSAKVKELVEYLQKSKKAHPVSGIELVLNNDYSVKKFLINGKLPEEHKTYNVATSDYLASGGDNMNFFKEPVNNTPLDYLIRNEIIDYFKKIDTIKTTADNRFIKL